MKRLRWRSDGGGYDLDMEAPVTMEGTARAVPGDPLPLGLSRGSRISRPKQLDFMHRFMFIPLVPSFSGDPSNAGAGFLCHRAHTLHLLRNWSATVLQQLHVRKLFSLFKERASKHPEETPWFKNIKRHLSDVFSYGFGTEFFITPESSLLIEGYDDKKGARSKAVFQHKFSQHNLMLEAASPGLFVDKHGIYWDVPLSMAVDLTSVTAGSGLDYHLSVQHNSGQPRHFGGDRTSEVPMSLLPGLCAKAAFSIKKYVNIWKEKEGKLPLVQPYDALLSNPHISGVGIIGVVTSASLGENSARLSVKDESSKFCRLCIQKNNLGLFTDLFATISFSAQHGNFQRTFLDLTRLNGCLEFPSGTTFVNGATCLSRDLYNSRQPDSHTICALCPDLRVSFQQQIIGPFSFRVDSKIKLDPENKKYFTRIEDSVFAIDWALKVLGSAKASFWYSPKHREAMVELRFFES